MTTEEIIRKLRRGDFIIVRVGNEYIISGMIEEICYVEPLGEESFYNIQLNFNGQTVFIDSRDNLKFTYWTEQRNEEYIDHLVQEDKLDWLFEKYQMNKENYLSESIDRWNDWDEEEKKIICEGIYSKIESTDIKDILDFIQNKTELINKLSQEANKLNKDLISRLENDIEFLKRYEKFKELFPEKIGNLYDFLLYKVWGYH